MTCDSKINLYINVQTLLLTFNDPPTAWYYFFHLNKHYTFQYGWRLSLF